MTRRAVIVTGGTRGLGRALVEEFLARDYDVLATFGRDEIAATAMRSAHGGAGEQLTTLMTGAAAGGATWDESARAWIDRLGAAELTLVNNASAPVRPEPLHYTSMDEARAHLETSCLLSLRWIQLASRHLARTRRGVVVNVLTSAIWAPVPKGFGVYVMAKSGLEGLTRAAAAELASHGVRVFSVSPTFMETNLTRDWPGAAKPPRPTLTPTGAARKIIELTADSAVIGAGEDYRLE